MTDRPSSGVEASELVHPAAVVEIFLGRLQLVAVDGEECERGRTR
jgi:hypothetical protein